MVKVKRTWPAPESLSVEALKTNGSYSCPDVITQLKADFHNKCYICELDHLQDPQVEHLLPHKNGKFPERKFAWNNLFWSCAHCNNVKNQEKYDTGIIDCCVEDPEKLIYFALVDKNIEVFARNRSDRKASLTAELIMEVFNLKNTGMRTYKSEMRVQELYREMNKLYDAIEELKDHPHSKFAMQKTKALLRRESRFAAFKRNYIRENLQMYPELSDYISQA